MGIETAELAEMCTTAAGDQVVAPANFNAPGQIVVAGHADAVSRLAALVVAAKGRAIPLKVSAPFHSALMAPAARVLEAELSRVTISEPLFPIVANFDAQANHEGRRVKELLVRQVDGAVRWEETIRLMVARGVTRALEIGPGKVLGGLAKRISKDLKVLSVGDTSSLNEVARFLDAA